MRGFYSANTSADPPTTAIKVVIVPHHITATTTIASGIRMLLHQNFSKVLLISPDHFNQCPKIACTTNGIYSTLFGTVTVSPDILTTLASSPLVQVEPEAFAQEHGIYAVVPYIKYYFPTVSVTPLLLSQRLPWQDQRQELRDLLSQAIRDDTMLIISSDFSHYLPLAGSDAYDEKAAKALFAKDLEGLKNLHNPNQSDCPNCLWLAASIADQQNAYNPSVVLHTNSARILDDLEAKSTTSHFAIVFYANASLDSSNAAFGGDITLTRSTDSKPALSKKLETFWHGPGPRILNLEGPLAPLCDTSLNPYIFCNSEALWKEIHSFATLWGVENNHMLDQGIAGVQTTIETLMKNGATAITHDGYESTDLRVFAVTALLNPVENRSLVDIVKENQQVRDRLRAKKDDKLTVVFVHAGTEYQSLITDDERKYLQSFIDDGADAVVAMHTHVVSDMEIYKGKPIFHGLGNLYFDQRNSVATSTAEMVRLKKVRDTVQFETLISQ